MILTGDQLRAGRALAGIDQAELSKIAGVGINTVRNLEAAGAAELGGYATTREKVQKALEGLGIEFTNGDAPGVRLHKRTREPALKSSGKAGGEKAGSRAPHTGTGTAAKMIAAAGLAKPSKKSSEMAGEVIDRLIDKAAPAQERERRKRRLIKGPSEFREMRGRKPKA
jgi:transcriptional regulator with XRE-family HTH domain